MITASSRRTPGPIRSAVSVRVKRSWPTLRFTRNAWGYGSRRSPGRRGFGLALLLLRRCPLHESLAALHLVGQRRLVDLDHDGIGVDAEVLHERLRDVAHHAGLLLIGAAGGHAHGNFRHTITPFVFLHSPDRHCRT